MTELYPATTDLNALSGRLDAEQEVLYVATGESPYFTSFYKMLYRLLDVSRRAGDLRVYKDGDLTFGVRAGRFMDGSARRTFAAVGGQALADNAVNSIYITAAGALVATTGGFPDPAATPHIPLATIATGMASAGGTAGAYAHDDIVDYRGAAMFAPRDGLTRRDVPAAPDAVIPVQRGASDQASFANLAAAYAAAKALRPGGNALSAANRACVLIPPGRYAATPTIGNRAAAATAFAAPNSNIVFTAVKPGSESNAIGVHLVSGGGNGTVSVDLDGNVIVHLAVGTTTAAAVVANVNAHSGASALVHAAYAAGNDGSGLVAAVNLTLAGGTDGPAALVLDADFVDMVASVPGNPDGVVITSPGGDGAGETIRQTASDIRLAGITIENTGSYGNNSDVVNCPGNHALVLAAADNSASVYRDLVMRQTNAFIGNAGAGTGAQSVIGITNIKGTWHSCVAVGLGWRLATGKTLGGAFYDCQAGDSAWAGDADGATVSGRFYRCVGGASSFGGCATFGCDITAAAYFEECSAGDNSFGLSKTVAGTFIRCRGGANCFAGYTDSEDVFPIFSGYAEDCAAAGNSFGGGHANARLSGRLVRCRATGAAESWRLAGAKVEDSVLQVTAANKDCAVLTDNACTLRNSTLLAGAGGKSVSAATARTAAIYHCRTNGGFANVTSTVAAPSNVNDGAVAL